MKTSPKASKPVSPPREELVESAQEKLSRLQENTLIADRAKHEMALNELTELHEQVKERNSPDKKLPDQATVAGSVGESMPESCGGSMLAGAKLESATQGFKLDNIAD